jgi:hypothetical protein
MAWAFSAEIAEIENVCSLLRIQMFTFCIRNTTDRS